MRFLKVHCCTWNTGDDGPPSDKLHSLLGLELKDRPDIISVALQEVVSPDDWRKTLIEHLHPSGYVLVKSRNCWAIWIFLFVRRNLLPAITNIESEVTPSGYGGVMGNKGGVSVRFEICGVNVIFMSSHFAAHAERTKDRLNDYLEIIGHQSFRDDDVHSVLDHDYVFWMGDLNFRLEHITKPVAEKLIQQNRLPELLTHDQLLVNKKKGLIFEDFEEGEINFPPTFKFDKGTDRYDSSAKQRVPAWTDRILYMAHRDFATEHYSTLMQDPKAQAISRHLPVRGAPSEVEHSYPSNRRASLGTLQPEIELLQYTSLSKYKSSDHRPVVGTFQFTVPSRWFSLPISFIEPQGTDHPHGTDLEYSYTLMDPPTLLQLSDTDSMLTTKPVIPAVGFFQLMLICALGKQCTNETDADKPEQPNLLAPAALEKAMLDWIGVYPSDFADLENDYLTYVYASKTSTSMARELHSETSHCSMNSCYKGKILARYLSELKDQSIQLIYWSRNKNCPQGYSSRLLLKQP